MPDKKTQKYDPAILWPCLSIALCGLHPLFIFTVFFSIYKYREPWIKQINQQLFTYQWWYFAFPVFAFIVGYLNVMPFVRDDLMMHVIAYKFDYDYRSIFVYSSPLPSFNSWIGFQTVAGKFHQLLGAEYSVRAIQAIAVVVFYTSFGFALYSLLKNRPDKWLWCTIIFALCAAPMGRAFLGRPDVFYVAWLISAVFLRPIAWLIIGIIIMPGYVLSIIYAPGALLLKTSWRNKIIYGALFAISCFIFWQSYTKGAWLDLPSMYTVWAKNRVMDMAETGNALQVVLANISLIGLLILLYYFLSKASFKLTAVAIPFCLLIAYFLLPNFIRYMLAVTALTGLLCALYVPKEIKFNQTWSLLILILAALMTSRATPTIIDYEKVPKFSLPKNAVLLSKFNDGGLHSAVLHNPYAKFAPAMEIGATEKPVQSLILSLHAGGPLDCNELKKFSFTHVQENSLKSIPPCLQLSQVDGNWRLWEIK
jgi:hypothetical protein